MDSLGSMKTRLQNTDYQRGKGSRPGNVCLMWLYPNVAPWLQYSKFLWLEYCQGKRRFPLDLAKIWPFNLSCIIRHLQSPSVPNAFITSPNRCLPYSPVLHQQPLIRGQGPISAPHDCPSSQPQTSMTDHASMIDCRPSELQAHISAPPFLDRRKTWMESLPASSFSLFSLYLISPISPHLAQNPSGAAL